MAELVEVYNDLNMRDVSRIENLPPSTVDGQPVVHEQLNAAIEGLAFKDDVRAGSVANVNIASPGAAIDGVTLATNDRVLLKDQSSADENGIYIFNGAASPMTRAVDMDADAEFNSATVNVTEGTTNAGTTFRQTAVDPVVDTDAINWIPFGTGAPAASETTAGIAEIATQPETDTGTDDVRFVTPLKLANWSGRKLKVSGTLGDGAALIFNVSHNLNTLAFTWDVYQTGGTGRSIQVAVDRVDANTAQFRFNSAPALNEFTYVILA